MNTQSSRSLLYSNDGLTSVPDAQSRRAVVSGVGLQTSVCVGEEVEPHHVTAGLSTEVVGAGGVRWQGVSGTDHVTCPPLGPRRVVQVGVRGVHPELTPGGQQIHDSSFYYFIR